MSILTSPLGDSDTLSGLRTTTLSHLCALLPFVSIPIGEGKKKICGTHTDIH
jgi:hypothetical protein